MPTQRDPDAPQPPEAHAPQAQIEPLSPPHDGLLVPLLYDLTQPLIDRGRAHGKLPAGRTDEWLDAHPDQQFATILIAGVAGHLHPPHRTAIDLLKLVSDDVADGYRAPSTFPMAERLRQANARADAWHRHAEAETHARLAAERRLRELTEQPTPRPAPAWPPLASSDRAARRRRAS